LLIEHEAEEFAASVISLAETERADKVKTVSTSAQHERTA
jgi:hypothetical protein